MSAHLDGWVVVATTHEGGRRRSTPGLRTDTPHLAVTPAFGKDGEPSGPWHLTHVPTGLQIRCVTFTDEQMTPPILRALARRVHHLDWSFADQRDFPPGHKESFLAEERKLCVELYVAAEATWLHQGFYPQMANL